MDHIGIDVGNKDSQACMRNSAGEIMARDVTSAWSVRHMNRAGEGSAFRQIAD